MVTDERIKQVAELITDLREENVLLMEREMIKFKEDYNVDMVEDTKLFWFSAFRRYLTNRIVNDVLDDPMGLMLDHFLGLAKLKIDVLGTSWTMYMSSGFDYPSKEALDYVLDLMYKTDPE